MSNEIKSIPKASTHYEVASAIMNSVPVIKYKETIITLPTPQQTGTDMQRLTYANQKAESLIKNL